MAVVAFPVHAHTPFGGGGRRHQWSDAADERIGPMSCMSHSGAERAMGEGKQLAAVMPPHTRYINSDHMGRGAWLVRCARVGIVGFGD